MVVRLFLFVKNSHRKSLRCKLFQKKNSVSIPMYHWRLISLSQVGSKNYYGFRPYILGYFQTLFSNTAQIMKLSIKDFFSKRNQIQFPADLVTITEEIPNRKLFLYSVKVTRLDNTDGSLSMTKHLFGGSNSEPSHSESSASLHNTSIHNLSFYIILHSTFYTISKNKDVSSINHISVLLKYTFPSQHLLVQCHYHWHRSGDQLIQTKALMSFWCLY